MDPLWFQKEPLYHAGDGEPSYPDDAVSIFSSYSHFELPSQDKVSETLSKICLEDAKTSQLCLWCACREEQTKVDHLHQLVSQ